MAITFDNEHNFSGIWFYDDSAGTYTDRGAASSAFDYFPDDAVVGDYLLFGRESSRLGRPSFFHDIKLFIGTALATTSITVAWEYYHTTNGWTAISGLTDNSNSFQNAGEQIVTFPIQADTKTYKILNVNGNKSYWWARARITAISGLTEGGAQSTQTITAKDNTIKCDSEAAVTMSSLYAADVAGSWGVITKNADDNYLVEANLYFNSSHFTSKNEVIQLGKPNYLISYMMYGLANASMTFGEVLNEYGGSGSVLIQYTNHRTPYNHLYGSLYFYGSMYIRYGGQYGDPALYYRVYFYDSIINSSDLLYWTNYGGTDYKRIYRTLYDCPSWAYIYTSIDINGMKFTDGTGILSTKTVTINNVDFGTDKQCYKANASTIINLVNCTGPTEANMLLYNHATTKYPMSKRFTFDLKITDPKNSAINGATVKLTDDDGTETFNVSTDANGEITQQTITNFERWRLGGVYYTKTYSPFTLEISKAGYQTYKTEYTLDKARDFEIRLKHSNVCVDQEVMLS